MVLKAAFCFRPDVTAKRWRHLFVLECCDHLIDVALLIFFDACRSFCVLDVIVRQRESMYLAASSYKDP